MRITISTVQSLSFWPVSVRGLCSRSHSVVTSLETPIFFISRWRQHLALAWCRLGFRFGGRRVPGRTGRRSQALSPSCARPRRFHAEPSYSTITRLFGWERDGDGGPCSFGRLCLPGLCCGCGVIWRRAGGGWMRGCTSPRYGARLPVSNVGSRRRCAIVSGRIDSRVRWNCCWQPR